MKVFIDPSYSVFNQNELFNANNKALNRDDSLAPFVRMREALKNKNIEVQTADYLLQNHSSQEPVDYYSLGLMDNLDQISRMSHVQKKAFLIFEPPVVAPHLYEALPRLTQLFSAVYIHNTNGDAYSLKGVDKSKLHKFYCPQPFADALEPYWNNTQRKRRLVVINGNHKPVSFNNELYSARIKAMSLFLKLDFVDLYGRNWQKWWSRNSLWLPYWRHRKALLSIYKGPCDSKMEVLSQYDFCLCFENMYMQGYITEKIFDCFYAGTIPIYWGAPDIATLIPNNTYIDYRNFKNHKELHSYLTKMPQSELDDFKQNGRDFLKSFEGCKYYNSMEQVILTHSLGDVNAR